MNFRVPPRAAAVTTPAPRMQTFRLALAPILLASTAAVAQGISTPPLEASRSLLPPPSGDAASGLSVVLRARSLTAAPDARSVAEGDVELRRGGLVIRADRLEYLSRDDIARAQGDVRVQVGGARFSGPTLELQVQRVEGFF